MLLLLLIGMQRLCGRQMLLLSSWQLAGALLTQLLLQLLLNSLAQRLPGGKLSTQCQQTALTLLLVAHPWVVLWQWATHSSTAQGLSAAEVGL